MTENSTVAPPSSNLVISLPRSGLNWVRYCTERMTGLRTPGTPRLIEKGPVAFHRSHRALSNQPYGDRLSAPLYDATGQPFYDRVAVIIRNPLESYVRHAERDVRNLVDLVDNLSAFESFSGPKHVMYYEDLIDEIEPVVNLLRFFEISLVEQNPFDKDTIISWSDESRALYKDKFGKNMGTRSFDPTTRFDPIFHSRTIDSQEAERVLKLLKGLNGQIYEKYLLRYEL